MTVSPIIDRARLIEEQLAQASPDLLRELLTTFVNTLMSAEADAVCGAAYGTSSPNRVNRRNGYRARDFDTGTGTTAPSNGSSKGRQRRPNTVPLELARQAPVKVGPNDKRINEVTGQWARFASAILPAWARKSPQVAEVLPLLSLHGLSSGDFVPALEQFFGSAGLSAATVI